MKHLSDGALERLRQAAAWPNLEATPYVIVEELGQGGMGTVYRCHDEKLQRDVALKVLHPGLVRPDTKERLLREARILARLEHPGIVPVHDVGELEDGRTFYVMKRVQGRGLDEHLADVQNAEEVLRVFERLCEAVAFAHAHGVIHRDLKPSNVMVGSFGEVLVMDWGVAKILTRDAAGEEGHDDLQEAVTLLVDPHDDSTVASPVGAHTHPGTILGTPGYMAPEQARGQLDLVDARADVYALGAILLESLRPLDNVPKRLVALCQKAMAAAPALRYASVEALGSDVARFRTGQSVSAYPEGVVEQIVRLASRYRTPLLLLLAYLVVRALLILFADV